MNTETIQITPALLALLSVWLAMINGLTTIHLRLEASGEDLNSHSATDSSSLRCAAMTMALIGLKSVFITSI